VLEVQEHPEWGLGGWETPSQNTKGNSVRKGKPKTEKKMGTSNDQTKKTKKLVRRTRNNVGCSGVKTGGGYAKSKKEKGASGGLPPVGGWTKRR